MKNRLKLDFSLETAEERNNFLSTYLVQFDTLTPEEAETISNYLLWGKDSNGIPIGATTQLETRWTKPDEIDSLDEAIESPTFSDFQIHSLNDSTPYKIPRRVFNREEARKTAPPQLLQTFENLWNTIDYIDLEINFYELYVGKRTKPPREQLLNNFSYEKQLEIKEKAEQLNQYQYLKLRHRLIELRREQFTIRDSYTSVINPILPTFSQKLSNSVTFDVDVEVLPLGLFKEGNPIFKKNYDPRALNEDELWKVSDLIQKKKNTKLKTFDFRNLEAVYQLYLYDEELQNQIQVDEERFFIENNTADLFKTLKFYEELAELNEIQLRILELKKKRVKNSDIAAEINRDFGKSYTSNYISTIFRQKIIKKINEAAEFHLETVENWFYPENFKQCVDCGRVLYLHEKNWIRKARSKDGFQNRCKKCERKRRGKR